VRYYDIFVQALFSYRRGSYNNREGNTTFAVSCSSFVVEKITKESCRLRTHERAVYNWPCANGSMRRSRAVLTNVRPWQPLKVVAYARRRGNCRRCTVQSLPAGVKLNEICGMQCVWLFCSKQTSMKRRCRAEIWTRALHTSPFSMEMLRWMAQIAPTFSLKWCGGVEGCDNVAR